MRVHRPHKIFQGEIGMVDLEHCEICGKETKLGGLVIHDKFICERCAIAISVRLKCGELDIKSAEVKE